MKKKYFFKIISIICIILLLQFSQKVYAIPPSSNEIYNGIDVSQWQGEINYEEVKNDGIKIVYIKATEGQRFVDPYFEENYINAKANEIKIGFYHYLIARNEEEAIEEATHFVRTISGKEIDCKLAMDFEDFGNLSIQEINNISKKFLETVERLSGKEAIIYSDANNARNIFSEELTNYPLWIAEYDVERPSDNVKWTNWEGWQYTDNGRVNGIFGNVDKDYFTQEIILKDKSVIQNPEKPTEMQEYIYIKVRRGDTLTQIAKQYNTTIEELVDLNNISNPNLIYVNQILKVPTIVTGENNNYAEYVVRKGDTLTKLAQEYSTTVTTLVNLNNISNPNLIYIGQIIKIPRNQTQNCENYVIKYGDTLTSIAKKFSTTIGNIAKSNGIKNINIIYAGDTIRICK